MKRPAFQFYPADWRKDNQLQSCSLASQGFWMNAMCIAHECEPYGHLMLNGHAMNAPQLAKLIGITAKEAEKAIAELEHHGVVSRCEKGCLYSRRMVRDEGLRQRRAEGGAAGAEHGVKGGRPPRKENPLPNPLEDAVRGTERGFGNNPPSSSSSFSSSSSATAKEKKPEATASGKEKRATRFPSDFEIHDSHRSKATELGLDVKHEFEKFRDNAVAHGKKYEVWSVAFTNWLRRADEFKGSKPNGSSKQSALEERNRQATQEWLRRGEPREPEIFDAIATERQG